MGQSVHFVRYSLATTLGRVVEEVPAPETADVYARLPSEACRAVDLPPASGRKLKAVPWLPYDEALLERVLHHVGTLLGQA